MLTRHTAYNIVNVKNYKFKKLGRTPIANNLQKYKNYYSDVLQTTTQSEQFHNVKHSTNRNQNSVLYSVSQL